MKNVTVAHLGTKLIEIKGNNESEEGLDVKHFVYHGFTLKADHINETALFSVDFSSQLESPIRPFILRTISQFEFKEFIVDSDKYAILQDYIFFAYRKHLSILKENLNNQDYIKKINDEFPAFQKGANTLNPIELILKNNIRSNDLIHY